jgi:hypothetical protein
LFHEKVQGERQISVKGKEVIADVSKGLVREVPNESCRIVGSETEEDNLPQEIQRLHPSVSWPEGSAPRDSIGMGRPPDTIRINPADYGKIWIDLRE